MNNTVIASPRILIPVLELNQNADGSVNVPKVLQPYMQKEVISCELGDKDRKKVSSGGMLKYS